MYVLEIKRDCFNGSEKGSFGIVYDLVQNQSRRCPKTFCEKKIELSQSRYIITPFLSLGLLGRPGTLLASKLPNPFRAKVA